MTPFSIVIISLILCPIVAYLLIRISKIHQRTQNIFISLCCVLSAIIIIVWLFHIVTISVTLNWILVSFNYLTISLLLCKTQVIKIKLIKKTGLIFMIIVFGIGYLACTIGGLFTAFAISDLETDQNKWLTDNLIYKERNIGVGPDPSVRLKKVEVYQKIKWLPFLVKRIKLKTYDEWNFPLEKNLSVIYSKSLNTIFLSSHVTGYKVFDWKDSININQ